MDTYKAHNLAHQLLDTHQLDAWSFDFDRATRRFGVCKYRTKTITLSRVLTEINPESEVTETLLHEIAHALVGPGNGHGGVWLKKLREIGGTGGRTHSAAVPPARWLGTCPNGHVSQRQRMSRTDTACGPCCNAHNRGKFSADYLLVFTRNPAAL